MIVDDTESLKQWLISTLQPICDAEPEALAKYTVALVRKEVPEDELKSSIIADLNVFLLDSTAAFVEQLFTVLADKSYILRSEVVDAKEDGVIPAVRRQGSEDDLSDGDRDHRRRRSRSRSPQQPSQPRRRSPVHHRLGTDRRFLQSNYRSRRPSNRGRFNGGRRHWDGPRQRPRSRTPSPRRELRPSSRSRSPRPSVREPFPLLSNVMTNPSSAPTAVPALRVPKPRCRDYDEQGYCMKGDQCEFDHGSDAVVMTDVTRLQRFAPAEPIVNGAAPTRTVIAQQFPAPGQLGIIEPYNPEIPDLQGPLPWRPPMPMMRRGPPPHNLQRMVPNFYGPRRGMAPPIRNITHVTHMEVPYGAGPRPDNFAGVQYHPMRPHPNSDLSKQMPMGGVKRPRYRDPNNATLEVRKIPTALNSIAKLNEHFSKFGIIVNLQVCFQQDPEAALVTFSKNSEAKAAYSCPEPLFNNRFIKIFWHNENNNASSDHGQVKKEPATGSVSRPSESHTDGRPADSAKNGGKGEPNMNPATLKLNKRLPEVRKQKAALVRSISRQNKQAEIQKRKQMLLQEQLSQQKVLIAKIEQCKISEEKSQLMKTLKVLDESVEKIRRELVQPASKTKEQTTKDLLDTELEIHQRHQSGQETAELRERLAALKKEATALGLMTPSRRGWGRRGGASGVLHRLPSHEPKPTALMVTGFKAEDRAAVLKHFQDYGIAAEQEFLPGPPATIIVNFDTRHNAEVAAMHGGAFKESRLVLKWFRGHQQQAVDPSKALNAVTHISKEPVDADDILAEDDGTEEGVLDDDLLLGEDDEEDDKDKRVW